MLELEYYISQYTRLPFYAQFFRWYTFLRTTRRPRVLAVEYMCNHVIRGVELRVSSAANRRSSRAVALPFLKTGSAGEPGSRWDTYMYHGLYVPDRNQTAECPRRLRIGGPWIARTVQVSAQSHLNCTCVRIFAPRERISITIGDASKVTRFCPGPGIETG